MRNRDRQYVEYLGSLQWHAKREDALRRAGRKCNRCPATKDLEVHHRHYDTLYRERPEDLEVLCMRCHDAADIERREESRWKAGLKTFAQKKYGEDWGGRDVCDVAQEYSDWLERRADSY